MDEDYSPLGAYNQGHQDGSAAAALDIDRIESNLRRANARIMKLQGIILDILPMVPYEQRVHARNMFMAAHTPALTWTEVEA